MPRVCANVWVNSFVTGVPSGYEYVCWDASDDIDSPPGGGGGSSGGGGSGGGGVGFITSPSGSGTVVAPGPEPDYDATLDLNLGWNSGAHSVQSVPSDWTGGIECSIPDVQGARPAGVAVGLAPISALPTIGRSGYAHLTYGLVFTGTEIRVISGGTQKATFDYADVRASRPVWAGDADYIWWALHGEYFEVFVNDLHLDSGPFVMPENYALDATLYSAYDAVDDPVFYDEEYVGDALIGSLPAFEMDGASPAFAELAAPMAGLEARLSELSQADIVGALPRFTMTAGDLGDGGITGSLGRLQMLAYSGSAYGEVQGSLRALQMTGGMEESDDLSYSMLTASMPRMFMTAEAPRTGRLDAALPGFFMRASSEATYSELSAELRGFRFAAYGGEMTPLVQIMETVAYYAPVFQSTYMGIAFTEHVDGTATAAVYATVTADGSEEITAQDTATAILTMLDSIAEQVGAGERFTASVFRTGGGALVDDSQAWVVNTESNASTRYDNYGFNSFATVRGKQFGARQDGLYLLAGADDAGVPISSGVALGMHDFGTQALKRLDSVYAGVSSTGALFIKVGDGVNSYSYRARRNDDRMKVQRFDIGRGIRTNYFTFDLTSDADAFELDSVTFHVLPTNRRI